MQVLIRKCDRCGAKMSEQTFNGESPITTPARYSFVFSELIRSDVKVELYEICDDCALGLLDWMKKKDTAVVKPPLEAPKALDIPEKRPIKLKPGTRTHHIWTNEDDDFLLYHSAGLTVKQIAYKLGVTVCAVYNRKARLLNGDV